MTLLHRKKILLLGSVLAVGGLIAVTAPAFAQEAAPTGAVSVPVVQSAPGAVEMPPEAQLKQPDPAGATPAPSTVVVSTPADASAAPAAEAETVVSTTKLTAEELKEKAPEGEPKKPKKKKLSKKEAQQLEKDLEHAVAPPAPVRDLPERYLVVKKDHAAGDPDARLSAARAALAMERYDAALEMFNDLYVQTPMDKRVLMGRAITLQKMGRSGEAMAAYEEVLNNDPKNIEALVNMLGILQSQDQPVAVERLSMLREVYPYNPDISAQLGMAYARGGDYENAMKYLDIADSLKSGSATILYNRAIVYDRMGKTQKAVELYKQVLHLSANGDIEEGFPLDSIKNRLRTIQ